MFSLKTVITNVWDNKLKLLFSVIICGFLFGVWGCAVYIDSKSELSKAENTKEAEAYYARLSEYDEAIADYEESIVLAKEQLELVKTYYENSVYMQIDPKNVQTGCIKYLLEVTEGNSSDIINLVNTYVNLGGLVSDISSNYETGDEYLQELISAANNGNVITVTAIHYSAEELEKLLSLIKDAVDGYISGEIAGTGKFTLSVTDYYIYQRSNTTVLNTQNTTLNNYKNNTSSLASLEKSLIDQQSNRTKYETNEKPKKLTTAEDGVKRLRDILRYGVLGLITGAALPFIWFALCQIIGDTISSESELVTRGLPIYGTYRKKTGAFDNPDSVVSSAVFTSGKKGIKSIFVDGVTLSKKGAGAPEAYKDILKKKGITVYTADTGNGIPEDILKLRETPCCIAAVELGRTTYSELETRLSLYGKTDVEAWGCIVVK